MRKQRQSHLRWVRLGDLRPHPQAQREFRPHRAEKLAATFSLEAMGFIVVSQHSDVFWVIDGQHRVYALRLIGFADDDVLQCEVYENLSLEEEAELFLTRNDSLTVAALDRFRTAVTAGRRAETEVDACVRAQGLVIGRRGSITAVSALMDAYKRTGVIGLGKTLRIIRDAYGETGFEGAVIQGTALTIQRYNGRIDEDQMIKALANAAGGLNGLLTQAAKTREALGQSRAQCIAATEVALYNRGNQTKRVPGWWKDA